jgi:Trk K+ transport system NAD-binding subunit
LDKGSGLVLDGITGEEQHLVTRLQYVVRPGKDSIVAIVREDQVLPSPGPAEILRSGDVLVVIGTEDGLAAVAHIVDEG